MKNFRQILLAWYHENHRQLPWRKTRDPYRIWISEIILQQTRIAQGTAYYLRFLDHFPDVFALAAAGEPEVLKVWQGLGYYSRARNLHHAARQVVDQYQGLFPGNYDKIINLKGIGEYTAAAILSISFGKPYPVVDGNVLRFISRLSGIREGIDTVKGKKAVLGIMNMHIGRQDPGTFNQAVMEFGALQCIPRNPSCEFCPFKEQCIAFSSQAVDHIPVKTAFKKQKTRFFNYFVIRWKDSCGQVHLYMRKRTGNDVWRNLYDFPVIETGEAASAEKLAGTAPWVQIFGENRNITISGQSKLIKHVLTHQIIQARFYEMEITSEQKPSLSFLLVPETQTGEFPVPRLIEEYLLNRRDLL